MKLRILSLWQPHATLCVTPSHHNPEVPAKPVETRGWSTTVSGWLGIHSAMRKDPHSKYMTGEKPFTDYIQDFDKLPFGYILGMVEVTNCLPTESLGMNSFVEMVSNEDQKRMAEIWAFGDFTAGRYGFTFKNFVKFTEPIRASGTQGFWYYDMPHNIGARVRTLSGKYGTLIDVIPGETITNCLICFDDDEKQWHPKGNFSIIQPAEQKALL